MDWFGILIIVIPIAGVSLLILDLWMEYRKWQRTVWARPPRPPRVRATYGPGYHPVLNWDWDEAYEGWEDHPHNRWAPYRKWQRFMCMFSIGWAHVLKRAVELDAALDSLHHWQDEISIGLRKEMRAVEGGPNAVTQNQT